MLSPFFLDGSQIVRNRGRAGQDTYYGIKPPTTTGAKTRLRLMGTPQADRVSTEEGKKKYIGEDTQVPLVCLTSWRAIPCTLTDVTCESVSVCVLFIDESVQVSNIDIVVHKSKYKKKRKVMLFSQLRTLFSYSSLSLHFALHHSPHPSQLHSALIVYSACCPSLSLPLSLSLAHTHTHQPPSTAIATVSDILHRQLIKKKQKKNTRHTSFKDCGRTRRHDHTWCKDNNSPRKLLTFPIALIQRQPGQACATLCSPGPHG